MIWKLNRDVLCEWLTRAAVCSSAYAKFALPRGTSCTQEEVALGRLVELATAALREGRTLAPAEAYELLEVLVAKSAAEVLLKHIVTEDVIGIDWDFCPLGFALERSAVFAGALVRKAEEFYEPYSLLMRHFGLMHVFAEAHSDEEREDAFRRYGAEAVITCLRRPQWKLKTYVVSCDAPNPVAEAVAKALGVQLQTGSARIAPGIYVV
jgi:hypothetical protein